MRLVFDRRDETLEAGYKAMMETPVIADRVNFSLEYFKSACNDFEVWGFYDGEPAGMLFFKDHHPHIAILKKYYGRCGRVIKQALNLSLEKYGYLIADVHKNNYKAIRFVERLGFKFKEANNEILTYTMDKK